MGTDTSHRRWRVLKWHSHRGEVMHDVLAAVPKKQAKSILAAEAKRRRIGDWGEWERVENPFRFKRDGWLGEVDHVMKNRVFSVLMRDVGVAIHMAVSSLSERRPTWHEMQRIKNELAGEKHTAVEVYPPQDELIDGANMFHIWVLFRPLPFSLRDDRHRSVRAVEFT